MSGGTPAPNPPLLNPLHSQGHASSGDTHGLQWPHGLPMHLGMGLPMHAAMQAMHPMHPMHPGLLQGMTQGMAMGMPMQPMHPAAIQVSINLRLHGTICASSMFT